MRWQVVGTESSGGVACIKLVGVQQSDDWERTRADHVAWRRRDVIWLHPQHKVAPADLGGSLRIGLGNGRRPWTIGDDLSVQASQLQSEPEAVVLPRQQDVQRDSQVGRDRTDGGGDWAGGKNDWGSAELTQGTERKLQIPNPKSQENP